MTVIAAALAALPASLLTIWALRRTPAARHVVAAPRADRWHTRSTPLLGGTGIFAGFLLAVGIAVAGGVIPASRPLGGIVGGCAILFVAGLVDDVFSLPPLAKLAAQGGAAALVIASGIHVQIISNDIAATALAVFWLIGMTNAFNLLDNMDGLAASLATIACAFFAVDAFTIHPNHMIAVLALGICSGCLGFLPYNLRLRRPASVFMGDSGSQLLGFSLGALGLASSWTVAGSTVATLLLPLLVLGVPLLDTTLVTVVRLLEGRPVTRAAATTRRTASSTRGSPTSAPSSSSRRLRGARADEPRVQGPRRHAHHAHRRAHHVRVPPPVRELPRGREPRAGLRPRAELRRLAPRPSQATRRSGRRLHADHRVVHGGVLHPAAGARASNGSATSSTCPSRRF